VSAGLPLHRESGCPLPPDLGAPNVGLGIALFPEHLEDEFGFRPDGRHELRGNEPELKDCGSFYN
jgi:hypothetical protein